MRVTMAGSWPGRHQLEAQKMAYDVLDGAGTGVLALPYLAETPGRGPGSDMIGRAVGMLVDMPADLSSFGWRLAGGMGREVLTSQRMARGDADTFAEVLGEEPSLIKVQVCGPWTLAASLWLSHGERVLGDHGAVRDVSDSLAEGVAEYVSAVSDAVGGSQIVLQVDEPSCAAVHHGSIPTASGLHRVRAVPENDMAAVWNRWIDTVKRASATSEVVMHTCAPRLPWNAVRTSGVDALSFDHSLLTIHEIDDAARAFDGPLAWWPSQPLSTDLSSLVSNVESAANRLGIPREQLTHCTVTSVCGAANKTPHDAAQWGKTLCQLASALTHA